MPASKSIRTLGAALLLALILLASLSLVVQAQSGDEQIEEGARLFAENCAMCHGPEGEGRVGATLSKNWPSIRPDLTVRTIIVNGVPGTAMPPWSKAKGGPLDNTQVEAIVAYILSWQTGGAALIEPGPTATRRPQISPPPEVQGDPNRGALLFDENCVVCHGLEGEGRIGASLVKNWPSIRPDLTIKTAITNGVSNTAMPAWGQANGGPLSETDVDDLVSFILSWEGAGSTTPQPQPTPTPSATSNFLRGPGGVILFIVLLVIILAAAMFIQRKR